MSALVAQRIERLRPKEGAGGSSPSEGAIDLNLKSVFSLVMRCELLIWSLKC